MDEEEAAGLEASVLFSCRLQIAACPAAMPNERVFHRDRKIRHFPIIGWPRRPPYVVRFWPSSRTNFTKSCSAAWECSRYATSHQNVKDVQDNNSLRILMRIQYSQRCISFWRVIKEHPRLTFAHVDRFLTPRWPFLLIFVYLRTFIRLF